MSDAADWAARLDAIENAAAEDVDWLADEFVQDACDPGAYFGSCKPEWGEIVRLLGPLLDRRPDLEGTGLLELLDNLAVGPCFAGEPAAVPGRAAQEGDSDPPERNFLPWSAAV